MKMPVLAFSYASVAMTYHFKADQAFGWALATINDTTGELTIQSDWGDWTYRWSPHHTGCPTFSHFIGERTRWDEQGLPAGRYYLADKLTSSDRHKREQFSPQKTVAALREEIIEKRRAGEIGRVLARRLWDALGEIEHENDVRDFVDGFYNHTEQRERELVWKYAIEFEKLRHEPTYGYLVLRDAILPALIEAVRARLPSTYEHAIRLYNEQAS